MSSALSMEEAPKHHQHRSSESAVPVADVGSDAIPVAFHAQQYQAVPCIQTCSGATMGTTTFTANQREEWLRGMMQPSAAAAAAAAAAMAAAAAAAAVRRRGASTAGGAPSTSEATLHSGNVHNASVQQPIEKAHTPKAKSNLPCAGQMGSGVLSNAVGVWTSSGIAISESRASKIDETVDIGAQANPSGVYPVIRPLGFRGFPAQQPPRSPPGTMASRKQLKAAEVAATTNPLPGLAHPSGAAMHYLPHESITSRPLSAPASMLSTPTTTRTSSPAVGVFKRPHPPAVGSGREANAPGRSKGGSTAGGFGLSKAATRAAARAAAVASVISAVADHKANEARAVAAAAAAAAATGTTEFVKGGTGMLRTGRSKRDREGTGGGGRGGGTKQPRRPATAPASSTRAVAGTKYAESKTPLRGLLHNLQPHHLPLQNPGKPSYLSTSWGAESPIPTRPQWSSDCCAPFRPMRQSASPAIPAQQPHPQRSSGGACSHGGTAVAAKIAEAVAPSGAAAGRMNSKWPADKRPDAEPTARSSPESEDIYTDLWLTGMPWATSSPLNVENFELEMPVAPAPLDALRSDDRGSRDDDDEEEDVVVREASLFMHQDQVASLVQQGKEPSGGSRVGFALQEPRVVHMSSETAVHARTASSRDGGERAAGHVSGTRVPPPCRGAGTPANTDTVITSEEGLPLPLVVSTSKCGRRGDSSGVPEGAPGCLGAETSIVTRKPRQMTGSQAGLSELGPPLADGAETVSGPAHAPHPPPPPPPVAAGAAETTAPGATQENTHLSPPISPSTPPKITQPTTRQKLSPNADKPTAAAAASLPVWALLPPALPGLDVTASPSYPQSGPWPASSIDFVPADAGGSKTTALAGSGMNAAATITSNSPSTSPRSAPSSTQASTAATKSGTTDEAGDAEQAAPITNLVGAAMACGATVSPSASGPCPGKVSGAQAESSPSAPKLSPAASLASSGWTADASKSWTSAGGTSRNAADSKHDGTDSLQAVLMEGPSSTDVRPREVSTSRGRSDDGDGRRGGGPGPSAR